MNMLSLILGQAQSPLGGGMSSFVMIALLIVIFYFFMIRPQSQKQKKINAFREGMKKGDKVMTAGGILGRVREIKDDIVTLEIDKNVTIRILKSSVYETAQDLTDTSATPQE